MAINADRYIKHCLNDRLIPFINKHHHATRYVFWPDPASSHYAKKTVEFLNQQNIEFIPKNENPANVPECRPIERSNLVFFKISSFGQWLASNKFETDRKKNSIMCQ